MTPGLAVALGVPFNRGSGSAGGVPALDWTWADSGDDLPAARKALGRGNTYNPDDGEIYTSGGFNAGLGQDTTYSYDPSSGVVTWYSMDAMPAAVYWPAQIVVKHQGTHKLYSFGGLNPRTDAIYRFDPTAGAGSRWTTLSATLPRACHHASVANDPDAEVVWYGEGSIGGSETGPLHKFDYSAATESMGSEITTNPTPQWAGAMFFRSGKVFLIGGNTPSETRTDRVAIYDSVADSWSTGTVIPDVVRMMCYASRGAYAYILGGERSGLVAIDEVRRYDLENDEWVLLNALHTAQNSAACGLSSADNKCFVMAGENSSGSPQTIIQEGTP